VVLVQPLHLLAVLAVLAPVQVAEVALVQPLHRSLAASAASNPLGLVVPQ
jgi:hypothetical protein